MATLALSIAGSFLPGWLGAVGAAAGAGLGGYIDQQYLFRRTVEVDGPRIQDIPTMTSSYGQPIPMVWGAKRMPGLLVWKADRRVVKTTHEEDVGKGGGGTTIVTTSYQVYQTFAVMLCRGPIDGVLRIWADEKLIYSAVATNESVTKLEGLQFRVWTGTEVQDPDPWMEAEDGVGEVPAYRDRAGITFKSMPLEKFGNRMPNISAEVAKDVAYTVPDFDIDEVTATQSDNLVMAPDGFHAIVEDASVWQRVIPTTRDVVLSRDLSGTYSAFGYDVPYAGCNFDFDENGDIYTAAYYAASSRTHIIKLDGNTFTFQHVAGVYIDTAWAAQPVYVRVFRNPEHPYAVAILDSGIIATVYRGQYTTSQFGMSVNLFEKSGSEEYVSIALDHDNGIIYGLAVDASTGDSWVDRLTPVASNGTITHTDPSDSKEVTSTTSDCTAIAFDADTNQVIVGNSSSNMYFFDTDTISFQGSLASVVPTNPVAMFQQGPVEGYFYAAISTRTIKKIDVANYTVETSWTTDDSGVSIDGMSVYDHYNNALICASQNSGETYKKIILDRFASVDADAETIITEIAEESGMDPSTEIDASDLSTALVPGYEINNRMPAREGANPLANALYFDGYDADGKIVFTLRDGVYDVALTEADIGAYRLGTEPPQRLIQTRIPDTRLPNSVEVVYIDPARNYAVGTQRALREVTQSRHAATIRLPMVLSADDARTVAAKALAVAWTERTGFEVAVSRQYAYLTPSDVVQLTMGNGDVHTFRLTSVDYAGGLVTLSGVRDADYLYDLSLTGYVPELAENITFPGPTVYAVIDVPLLAPAVNTPGMLVAGTGYTDAWSGGQVYQQKSAQSLAFLKSPWARIKTAAIMGRAQNALGDVADTSTWDESNTLSVRLYPTDETLDSKTKTQVLNGENHFVLMSDDAEVAEVCAFKTATMEADGSYTLSSLLRGRRGSEYATGDHSAGEMFVLLDADTLQFSETDLDYVDDPLYYRTVSVGMRRELGSVGLRQQTAYFRNIKPWSPVGIRGERDGSDNLTIYWTRRSRIANEWIGGETPLGEEDNIYEIDVIDNSSAGGGAIVRTISVESSSTNPPDEEEAEYTAAEQTTDFGATQASVDIIIYQLATWRQGNTIRSTDVRGFGGSATV